MKKKEEEIKTQVAYIEAQKKEIAKKNEELNAKLSQVEKEKELLEERMREIQEKEESIKTTTNFVNDVTLKTSKIIKLNVGGVQFMTSLTTLCADQDSMLAAMFSGRHELPKDDNGYYFIDRSGETFSIILEWLRTNFLLQFKNFDKEQLLLEAKYYQLHSLVRVLETEETSKDSCSEDAATLLASACIPEKKITCKEIAKKWLEESWPRVKANIINNNDPSFKNSWGIDENGYPVVYVPRGNDFGLLEQNQLVLFYVNLELEKKGFKIIKGLKVVFLKW